jgi:hypothetical protein
MDDQVTGHDDDAVMETRRIISQQKSTINLLHIHNSSLYFDRCLFHQPNSANEPIK